MDSVYDGPRLVSVSSNPTELDHGVCSRAISLPDDVLLKVFEFYLQVSAYDDEDEHYSQYMWLPLAQVSRKWRHILLRFPRALRLCIEWDIVDHDCSHTPEEIGRYPGIPLHIEFSSGPEVDVELFRSVVQYLPHAHKISINTHASALCQLILEMDKPAPNLESLSILSGEYLSIWTETPSKVTFPKNFLGGSTPLLRYLDVRGIPSGPALSLLPSDPNHFAPLRTLLLEIGDGQRYISSDSFLTYLSVMPQLEKLDIVLPKDSHGLSPDEPQPIQLTCHAPFVLPKLVQILFTCSSTWANGVLTAIITPSLERLGLEFNDTEAFPSSLVLGKFLSIAHPSISTFTSVRLGFFNAWANIDIESEPNKPPPISFTLKQPAYNAQLASISSIFTSLAPNLCSVESVFIEVCPTTGEFDVESAALESYRNTTTEWRTEVEPVLFRSLFRLLPNLQTLQLDSPLANGIGWALDEDSGGLSMGDLPRLATISIQLPPRAAPARGSPCHDQHVPGGMSLEEQLSWYFEPFVFERGRVGQNIRICFSRLSFFT